MTDDLASSQISPTPMLLAVIGSSPQVLTETLYGIYKSAQALPQVIKVITTVHGKQKMLEHNMFGSEGRVNQFTQEYALETISFELRDVLVIEDEQGQPLDDARSLSQHTALADFITEKVRQLSQASINGITLTLDDLPIQTQQLQQREIEETLKKQFSNMPGFREIKSASKKKQLQFTPIFDQYTIHASIAGGRKSMTFLLGYAMSLFGRSHDKVSHVLVDERVENWPHFFYPSKSQNIQPVGWDMPQSLDFSEMRVELAEIPLVRIGLSMPAVILNQSRSYSDTIDLFEELQQEPRLIIDLLPIKKQQNSSVHYRLTCGTQTAYLDAKDLSFLLAYADNPQRVMYNQTDSNDELVLTMLSWYATLCVNRRQHFTDTAQILKFFFSLEDADYSERFILGKDSNLADEFAYLQTKGYVRESGLGGVISGGYANNALRDLKSSLTQQIGEALALRYIPSRGGNEKGDSGTTKGRYFYGLDIKPENIKIINKPN